MMTIITNICWVLLHVTHRSKTMCALSHLRTLHTNPTKQELLLPPPHMIQMRTLRLREVKWLDRGIQPVSGRTKIQTQAA